MKFVFIFILILFTNSHSQLYAHSGDRNDKQAEAPLSLVSLLDESVHFYQSYRQEKWDDLKKSAQKMIDASEKLQKEANKIPLPLILQNIGEIKKLAQEIQNAGTDKDTEDFIDQGDKIAEHLQAILRTTNFKQNHDYLIYSCSRKKKKWLEATPGPQLGEHEHEVTNPYYPTLRYCAGHID